MNTHELSHRIDAQFVRSWEDGGFGAAIQNAKAVLEKEPQKYLQYCDENDKEGFLSDIFSAVCDAKYELPAGHKKSYWQAVGNKEKDVFANLFSMETFGDKEKLEFLKQDFPEILEAYYKLRSGI